MDQFIGKLQQDYPNLTFKEASRASWSAKHKQVGYRPDNKPASIWGVLHEVGHALAGHDSYESDINLLRKEVEAWDKALQIAKNYAIAIDENYIQDCLDTYRDWLHKRSTCPTCEAHGLQRSVNLYGCFNCQTTWSVSPSRLCRPYRLSEKQK